MHVLILPVSGGGFVNQLAIIQHLCESQYVPDVTLASSGGNVAAYVAAAAGWKWAGIQRIASQLHKELFISPWNPLSGLSYIVGYFEGNVYNKGMGVSGFLRKYFTPSSISQYEIWTGTYSKQHQKARVFCNRRRDQTLLDPERIDHELTQSMEPVFADGDFDMIGQVGLASASIPGLVPGENIDGVQYIDGGVASASPLIVMREPILDRVRNNHETLHMIYINSVDLSQSATKDCRNVIDTWKQAAKDMVRSQTVNDRLSAFELLRCQPGHLNKNEFTCTYDNLERVKRIRRRVSYSLLEIYPLNKKDIDLVSFKGSDVTQAIKEVYGHCACRLWWLSDTRDNIEIQRILDDTV